MKYVSVKAIVSGAALLFLLLGAGSMFEWVESSQMTRVRYPWGSVVWYTDTQGPKPQLFGSTTTYDRRGTIAFHQLEGETDERRSIDFNDRGTGKISGSINYEHSVDHARLEEMYRRYPSQLALENSLIKPAVNSGIYITGQLMSSFESYSTRKSELVAYVEDQAQRGTYRTESVEVEVVDQLDPTKTTTAMRSQIVADQTAPLGRARSGGGEIDRYGIRVFQFAIERLDYDETVNEQIKRQQEIMQSVNTSRARALEAQQNEITSVADGRARVAQAEAVQREKNATLVEEARGLAEQAKADAIRAEAQRQAAVLRAQGEAEANRLRVVAGLSPQERGALVLEAHKTWATAFANSSQPLVPAVVMGGGGGSQNAMNGAQQMMDILGTRAARDFGLELSVAARDAAQRSQTARAPQAPAPTAGRGRGDAPQVQTAAAR